MFLLHAFPTNQRNSIINIQSLKRPRESGLSTPIKNIRAFRLLTSYSGRLHGLDMHRRKFKQTAVANLRIPQRREESIPWAFFAIVTAYTITSFVRERHGTTARLSEATETIRNASIIIYASISSKICKFK